MRVIGQKGRELVLGEQLDGKSSGREREGCNLCTLRGTNDGCGLLPHSIDLREVVPHDILFHLPRKDINYKIK